MSIYVSLKLKSNSKNKTIIECDLSQYLNNFNKLVNDIHKSINTKTPINIFSDLEVIDTPYFKDIYDIKTFLSIDFQYGYLPYHYLEWICETDKPMDSYKEFNDKYIGAVDSTTAFTKNYITHNFKNIPPMITECINYEKVWKNFLSKNFMELKSEQKSNNGISIYTCVIYKI